MISGLLAWVAAATLRDSVLVVLLGVIVALFMGTIALSIYAILLRARHRARDRLDRHLDERWTEPLLRAVSGSGTVEAVHELVDERTQLRFVGFVLQYARRVRGEERDVLQAVVQPFLGLIARRADARRVEIRTRALQTLGTLGLPEYASRVIGALDDRSPLVAMVAARSLARPKTPQYAEDVLARLPRFDGWSRRFLASMLASMGPEVSEVFRARLADEDVVPWVRAVVADALYLQRDLLAADPAAELLGTSDDRELRISALRLLGEVGRPTHLPMVRELCGARDPAVRAQAIRALGILGGAEDVPELLEWMDDPFPWAALYAARGARSAGGGRELEELAVSGDRRADLARQILAEAAGP